MTISATNVRTSAGGALPIGPGFQAARFAGRGSQNQIVIVRIQQTTINIIGPGPAMRVRDFTIGPEGSLAPIIAPLYRILTPSGIFWFNVGATLEVGANQPSGSYSGTFTAELLYL